jgi:RNA polymerase sigma factor (sigma-70 family)
MSDSIPTLEFWLDRLRRGEPAARNELIRHSRERFRLLTRQMMRRFPGLREWEETSDVLQGVLIRLDRALQQIDVPTPLDFFRLAAHHINFELIDLTRHHYGPAGRGTHLLPPGQIGDLFPEPIDEAADPFDLAKWGALHEYIANLPADERQLWHLRYYQGLTHEESAALLGMSLRTLQRRWHDALIKCRIRLGDDWPLAGG